MICARRSTACATASKARSLRIADSAEASEIESAVAETDRLIGTFNALLLIAEAEAGVVREAMTLVDLARHRRRRGRALRARGRGKEHRAGDWRPPVPCRSRATSSLISQALANLIDNAIKYTPPGGHVRVAVEETPDGVALTRRRYRARHSRCGPQARARPFRAARGQPQFAGHRAGPEPRRRRRPPARRPASNSTTMRRA